MDAVLPTFIQQWSPQLREAIASILEATLDQPRKARLAAIRLLRGQPVSPCAHPGAVYTCTGCSQQRHEPYAPCCHTRDPAVRLECPSCGTDTLC